MRSGRKPREGGRSKRCAIAWEGLRGVRGEIDRALAAKAVEAALRRDGLAGRSLTVLVVDDPACIALHRDHFGDATATDVMSFPDGAPDPESGRVRLGDLAVCLDEARRVARRRRRPVGEEVALYVLHGALHLLGYDDQDPRDRRAMWAVQREIMSGLGVAIGS